MSEHDTQRVLFPYLNVLLESRRKTRIHGRSSRKHNVLVKLGTKINVGTLNRLEQQIGHSTSLKKRGENIITN